MKTYETYVMQFVNQILLKGIIPIIMALSVFYFLLGVWKFIQGAADPKARVEGRRRMFIGLLAIAIMVTVWGLVAIVARTFGVNTVGIPQFK